MKELKPIDIDIASEYIKTGNGVQSVLKMFPNKTIETAKKYFTRLSTNVHFLKIIEESKELATDKLNITVDRQLSELERIKDLAEAKGKFRDSINALKEQNRLSGYYEKDNSQHGVDWSKVRIGFE